MNCCVQQMRRQSFPPWQLEQKGARLLAAVRILDGSEQA
jgi:hypothetical protein